MLIEEEVKSFYELMTKLGCVKINWFIPWNEVILPECPEDLESLKKALEIVELVKGSKIEETVWCEVTDNWKREIIINKTGIWISRYLANKILDRSVGPREELSLEEVEKIFRQLEEWWFSGETGVCSS